MTWTPGPARCRSDEYEAEILATDMGWGKPILARYRAKDGKVWQWASLYPNGQVCKDHKNDRDIIPPRLSLEEAARECATKVGIHESWNPTVLCMIQHFIRLQEEGRV